MTRDETPPQDSYLWLEDIVEESALTWVTHHNDRTIAELADSSFHSLCEKILTLLDSDDRIPYPARRGEWLYNFWRDNAHPRGLWRRTLRDSFRNDHPAWEVLLDLDELALNEGENWVWGGAKVLYPDRDLALITLSRGGSDAAVVREFLLPEKTFVDSGFSLTEGKNFVSWAYRDELLVGADFGLDSSGQSTLTHSGYPRSVRRWERGKPLSSAKVVFTGEPNDVLAHGWADRTPGFEREFVTRMIDFHHKVLYEILAGSLIEIPLPQDAETVIHEDWLFVRPRSAWQFQGTLYPAGSLLVMDYEDLKASLHDADASVATTVLFTPDGSTSLTRFTFTLGFLVLELLRDVRSELLLLTLGDWQPTSLEGVPAFAEVSVLTADPDEDDDLYITAMSFTSPTRLLLGSAESGLSLVKQSPTFWDSTDVEVRQHFALSPDGTRIPYFLVGKTLDQPTPTLQYGYGGFEHSLTPAYNSVLGVSWLEKGGTYVLANIRGGGEYGPSWHTAALRENRSLAFADFAAVASDLVARNVCSTAQLGAMGGSNGGLLMGVMATRYPELFGALVCQVPLADMLRYHLLLAGASWIAEYGDPDIPADREFLARYSPYHNVPPQDTPTPDLLITTSTKDDRVHPGHARKLAAKFEEQGHAVWYYENVEGGHGMAADNKQTSFMSALSYRFFATRLGLGS